MMSRKKKVILLVAIISLSALLTVAGILAYCLASPERTKALIEKTVEDVIGVQVAVKHIEYTVSPIHFMLQQVTLKPVEGNHQTGASISEVAVDFHREGPFGRKTLIVDSIRINTPSLQLRPKSSLPAPSPGSRSSSIVSTFLKGITGLFLFREIDFRNIEIDNGDLAFIYDMGAVTLSNIDGRMNAENHIEITCESRTFLTEPDITMLLPDIHAATKHSFSPARLDISAKVAISHASVTTPWGRLDNVDLNSCIEYEQEKNLLTWNAFEFMGKGTFGKGAAAYPCEIGGKMDGAFDLHTADIHAKQFSLNAKDLFSLQGALKAGFRNGERIILDIFEGSFFPSRLKAFLPETTKKAMRTAHLGGPVQVRGAVKGLNSNDAWNYHCDLKTFFYHNPASFSMENVSIKGGITGEISVRGEAANPTISADITTSGCTVDSPLCSLSPCSGRVKIDGRFPLFTMDTMALTIPKMHLVAGKKSLDIKDILLSSEKGYFDFLTKAFGLPLLSIDSAELHRIELQGEGDGELCRINLKGVNTGLLEFAQAQGFLPEGWKVSGSDTIRLSAEREKGKSWRLKTDLCVDTCNFEDGAALCIGEGIDAAVSVNCLYDPTDRFSSFDGSVRVTNGEVLFDKFYLDLGNHAATWGFKGHYGNREHNIVLREMNFALHERFAVDLKGQWTVYSSVSEGNIRIRMYEASVSPLFETFVREPFKAEHPALESITAGGTVSASLQIDKDRTGADILGHLHWKDGMLSYNNAQIHLTGLSLNLPLWIHTGTKMRAGNPLTGTLDIESLRMPFLPAQTFSLPLRAAPNALNIDSSTEVATPGGPLRIGPISFLEIAGPHPSIQSDISIEALDIGPFVPETVFPHIEGTLDGRLDPVKITKDMITTEGEIVADVFGGKAVVSHIRASPFLSGPLLSFDARIDGLDLAEMTTNTSFGKIEGILQGSIKGFEIAYGQPQKFDLFLETTPRKGVEQKISVKAVENIAKIGGGQSPFVGLAGVISSFFKEFHYEKIGVRASLRNDVFRINGTIKEGETEYIIKRGGFSGVNIVNQNPDNRISFKDMVKRIQRVTKESASPLIE